MNSKVVIVKVKGDIPKAFSYGINLIGGLKWSNINRAIIKPNLCCSLPPETGATTDVQVIQVLINYLLKKSNCKIDIIESNSYARSCKRVFKRMRYKNLENIPNVRLVNLSLNKMVPIHFKGQYFKEIKIPQTMVNYDFFITVAKLKTSIIHKMSGACKNQFGCLAEGEKRFYHPFLNEVLFDLNTLFKPHFCVVDGIVGMEGCGPTDGFPKKMDIIVFGREPVAVDAVLCHIMGIDPFDVPHLRYAFENGLGEIRLENIELLGEPIEKVRTKFEFVPENAYSKMELGLKLGRYPIPIRNLGILLFTWGNYLAGKEFSTRTERHRKEGRPSMWSFLKKSLWTTKWNV